MTFANHTMPEALGRYDLHRFMRLSVWDGSGITTSYWPPFVWSNWLWLLAKPRCYDACLDRGQNNEIYYKSYLAIEWSLWRGCRFKHRFRKRVSSPRKMNIRSGKSCILQENQWFSWGTHSFPERRPDNYLASAHIHHGFSCRPRLFLERTFFFLGLATFSGTDVSLSMASSKPLQ